MTRITSIKLGLVAMCIATVPLSLAQTPRIRTSGSNQIGTTTIRASAGHSGSSGNSNSAPQLGTNFRTSMNTGPNTNVAAHTGINAGAQTGINHPTGGAAPGLAMSSGNSAGATQIGANAQAGTNTTPNTNAGAHTAAAPASVTTILHQAITVPTQTPLPNNDRLNPNFSTSGPSPSSLPSASVSPTPSPTPARSL
jgi:hypothetical protein